MLKNIIVSFLFFAIIAPTSAQFNEQFSDGELANNPTWMGDLGNFIVNPSLELQLNASVAGSSVIYSNYTLPDSSIFEALIRMPFSPSTNNKLRWYFQSSSSNFAAANGYFIEIGEAGSTDGLKLFRQTGATVELIAAGNAGILSTTVNVRVKIERRAADKWTLWADYTGGSNYQLETSFTEPSFNVAGNYFVGFQCFYTASNSTKFYFDDIRIEAITADIVPPSLLAVQIVTDQELNLTFSEPIAPGSVVKGAFSINPSIGMPQDAFAAGANQVTLLLSNPLQNGTNYVLQWGSVADLSGNISPDQSYPFSYLIGNIPQAGDLIFTEIFPDPDPSIVLPVVEYVEIHNRTDNILSLEGVIFADATAEYPLPGINLSAGEYRVICRQSDTLLFANFGPTLGIPTFPTLTNSGEKLTLKTSNGIILHQVEYTMAWYQDVVKSNGGWSIELIDPSNLCNGAANWTASVDARGGTPGLVNSVFQIIDDTADIKILEVIPNSDTQLTVNFSKSVTGSIVGMNSIFHVVPGISVSSITYNPAIPNSAVLTLDQPLQKSVLYILEIDPGIADCQGNQNQFKQSYSFGLPDEPLPGDLIINEILFNPGTGGSRFVELYNASPKILNLNQFSLQNFNSSNSLPSQITTESLLLPGEYAVFTENPTDILSRFTVLTPTHLFLNDLPSLADKADNITVLFQSSSGPLMIDSLDYNESWHSPFLQDKNGISLERINASAPTNAASNWQSASSQAGYGTPTGPNSQYRAQTNAGDVELSIPEPVLSPDGDGYQDYLLVHYISKKNGGIANIKIFDVQGHSIKNLKSLSLLGESGDFKWEGDKDNGEKARMGIYTILFEVVYPDGHKSQAKLNCVLAVKL